ncbi:MAG: class I SAM-dependent methyltransferase [bacterium]
MAVERFKPARTKQFLDVGCGLGACVQAASELGWTAQGCELGEWVLKETRRKGINARIGSLEELHYNSESMDAVFFGSCLEYLGDPVKTLKESCRILKTSGLLIGSGDVNGRWLKFLGPEQLKKCYSAPPEMINYFTAKSIKTLLQKTGFKLLSLKTLGLPAGWTKRRQASLPAENRSGEFSFFYRIAKTAINSFLNLTGIGYSIRFIAKKK